MFCSIIARKRGGANCVIWLKAPSTSTLATTAQRRISNPPSMTPATRRKTQLRSSWRRMTLSTIALRPVVAEEDVLELRLGKDQVLDTGRRERAQQRVHIPPHPERELAPMHRAARHPGQFANAPGHVALKTHRELAYDFLAQPFDGLQCDDLAAAQDRHALAGRLDLRQDVRREEDRSS